MSNQLPETLSIPMARLRKLALSRPPGYLEDVTSYGTLTDGFLILSREDHRRLRHKYNPRHMAEESNCPECAGKLKNYIPEIPDEERKKREMARKEFRAAFLGPMEQVPSHVVHLRMALEERKAQMTYEGCTGCKLGSAISEFIERAWRAQIRHLKVRG